MKDFIAQISMIVVIISVITFLVGFFMVFFESKRKLALKILLLSVIAFVIGFSTCVATFSLKI
jgi:hypothetical protein